MGKDVQAAVQDGEKTKTYTDKEQITEILKHLQFESADADYIETPILNTIANYEVIVKGLDKNHNVWVQNAYFLKGSIPDFVQKDLQ